jgi:hypothetical protein
MRTLQPELSRYLAIQGEGVAVAAKIGEGANAIEVGTILREQPTENAVPGFGLFSETKRPLPHDPEKRSVTSELVDGVLQPVERKRILADEAIRLLREKNPEMSVEDAFVALFVKPLLDVYFSLAKQGMAMELHPQNFSLVFNEQTGHVDKVLIRDLHGLNYSAEYRQSKGLEDLFSVDALKKAFPDITQADLDGYFTRNGMLRDRFQAPGLFKTSLDFFLSIFFFQLLVSRFDAGSATRDDVNSLITRIQGEVQKAADTWGFDMKQLPQVNGSGADTFWRAYANSYYGMRGKVLFRGAAE